MILEELSKDEQWQADEQVGKGLIPCPFCGAKLGQSKVSAEKRSNNHEKSRRATGNIKFND